MFESLLYIRSAVLEGEVWRLATATLAHLSPGHLLLNALGLALVVALLWRQASLATLATAFLVSALATTLGVHWATTLDWYAGASSATLGLLAWGLTRLRWPLAIALSLLLLGGAVADLDRSESLLGEPLAAPAHLAGIIGGLAWGALTAIVAAIRRRGPAPPSTLRY